MNHLFTNYKNLYTYSSYIKTLAAPHWSHIGESHVDQKIKTLELKTPKNSP